ncbi:hypothetical protein [Novosphingobium sp. BL-52-GroH]|uniref:hypothetical protein n=1 Tax=Novosphingobium sp. BL-52-GroH TaxID=3349877 RepID=UPI00384AB489
MMASGPERRSKGAQVGVAVAIAVALALALGLSQGQAQNEADARSSLSDFPAEGRLVLWVLGPTLY